MLRIHCLGRILGDRDEDGEPREFTTQEYDGLRICDDRMYRHRVMRVNYTTYDCRCDQDSINPRTHPDILLPSADKDDEHPFSYARVIGIFHLFVTYRGPGATPRMRTQPERIDVLWVRWFELDRMRTSGPQYSALPRVEFPDASSDPDAIPFGFVDPGNVIRGAYIIPAWDHGECADFLKPSRLARRPSDEDADFNWYYVCT